MGSLNGFSGVPKKSASGNIVLMDLRRSVIRSRAGWDGTTQSDLIKRCSTGVLINIGSNKNYMWLDFGGSITDILPPFVAKMADR